MDSEADDDNDAGEVGEAVEASDGGPHMYLRMVPYTYMLAVMLTGHMAAATQAATASGSDKESEMVLCDGGRRGCRRLSLAAPCSSGSSDYIQEAG